MNELTCPCFMKTDLELAVDKLSFLEENYSCMKQKRYTCTITELIRLYECRENIILVIFVKYKSHPRL